MSGKITVRVRKGKSRDPQYPYYPEWYLEVEGEDGTIVTLSPSYEDIKKMLVDILVHELRVDITRKRRPDFVKWRKFIQELLSDKLIKEAQTIIQHYKIPSIYLYKD